jgi:hypothetical protein
MAVDDKTKAALLAQGDIKRDQVAEAGELLKEAAAARGPAVAAKRKQAEMALHIIPVEGENEEAAYNAAKWLEARKQAQAALRAKHREQDEKTFLYYLRCRNAHDEGGADVPPHGIYFVGVPNMGGVSDDGWYSRYKKRTSVRQSNSIVCQVCLKMGIPHQQLDYTWVEGANGEALMVPDPRWVWRTPQDPNLWAIIGETRAFDLQSEGQNSWRAEHEQKLAKAREEGVLTNG